MEYRVFEMLSQMKNAYEKLRNQVSLKFDLTDAEADILLYLASHKEDTATDIVSYTGYSKSNVSSAVRKLELKEYIKCEIHPENRRITHLKIMDKAKPIIRYGNSLKKKLDDSLEDAMGKESLDLFLKMASDMVNVVKGGKEK